jgi:hypothetical protein
MPKRTNIPQRGGRGGRARRAGRGSVIEL